MEIMHFNSQKERLDYLKGGYDEIQPVEVKAEPIDIEPIKKPKKSKKKEKKDDAVQAE